MESNIPDPETLSARIIIEGDDLYLNMTDLFIWLATLATTSLVSGKFEEAETIMAVGDALAAATPA